MVWQSTNTKKTFLVFMSLIFGGLVILGAAKITGVLGTNISFETPGANDSLWKSTLSVIPGGSTPTRVEKGSIQEERASVATTTTDLIARRLIVEYALSQKGAATSTMSDVDAKNIANVLAQEVKLPQEKQYRLNDLNVSKDNSENSGILYKKTLNTLIQNHLATEQKENELTILITAMNTKDPTSLNKLDTKVALYQQLINNLLALKTPSSVAQIHLHLLQGYEALRAATVGFKSMLADPAAGVASLTEYRNGVDTLLLAEKEYHDFNTAN